MAQAKRFITHPQSYSWAQIVLHWAIAALVIWQLFFSEHPPHERPGAAEADFWTLTLESSHVWIGLIVLALVVVRIALRLGHGAPALDDQDSRVVLVARIVHFLFYVLLVYMPVTGILAYYAGLPVGGLHELGQPVFIALIAVHVVAALWHQFVRRDHLMRRMLASSG